MDTKRAEKEYLHRTGTGVWETLKPFAPPGINVVDDATEMIQDFAVMLRVLAPTTDDLILDLGAGGCWCTDWLQRLNLRVVSVDIAFDMLHLGRSRLRDPDAARLVTGDMEALPFASGSFDKACCLSALHHVPSIQSALNEICRVLKPEGDVIFIEPGANHSQTPVARAAMENYGVLEQDIVTTDFIEQCMKAGFRDVRLLPMSYLFDDFTLSPAEWQAWSAHSRRRRPLRAVQRMGRALLELAGLGKKDALLEETLAMNLVRRLKGAMDDHPVVIASRAPMVRQPRKRKEPYAARIEVGTCDARGAECDVRGDQDVQLLVHLRNVGTSAWPAVESSGAPRVRIGVQLLDSQGHVISRDYFRHDLPRTIACGEACDVTVSVPRPAEGGLHALKVDLVVEGVTWFETRDSSASVMMGSGLQP